METDGKQNVAQKRKVSKTGVPGRKRRKIGDRAISRHTRQTFVFPPWRMMSDPLKFRPIAYSAIVSSIENAILSRNWKRAAYLVTAILKYSFIEVQSSQQSTVDKTKFNRFHEVFHLLLEVLFHLRGGDAAMNPLLDAGMRDKRYIGESKAFQSECRFLRSALLCCEGNLQDADACALVGQKELQGMIAFAKWTMKIRQIGAEEGIKLNPPGIVPVDFKHSDWISTDAECSRLANEVRIRMENVKDENTVPAIEIFYRLAYVYAVQGEWTSAVAVGKESCRVRPSDADAHTLNASLLLSSKACDASEACQSFIEILKCDPACKQVAHSLADLGVKHECDWNVQVMVAEGLMYHLDACPPNFRKRDWPPPFDDLTDARETWAAWSKTLMKLSAPVSDALENHTRIEHWERVQRALQARAKWWRKYVFQVHKPLQHDVGLGSVEDAEYLANVAVGSVFVLGKENEFCEGACEVLNMEGWVNIVDRIELVKDLQ